MIPFLFPLFTDVEGVLISSFESFKTRQSNLELIDFRKPKHLKYQRKN